MKNWPTNPVITGTVKLSSNFILIVSIIVAVKAIRKIILLKDKKINPIREAQDIKRIYCWNNCSNMCLYISKISV